MWDIIITRKNDINFAAQYRQGGDGNTEIIQYDSISKIINQEILQLIFLFSLSYRYTIFSKDIK